MGINQISLTTLKACNLDELSDISATIRNFLINSISKTGGHIGANLGTVELSVALHYVFDSPDDAIIWDTGHQGYTHKILTGRTKKFCTLNTYGGMSRFITREESEHDIMSASHAGTSISVALGRALALRNSQAPHWSIAVIGDGALSEGLALEALTHASVEQDIRMIIVLNDNGYAISPGFGAIHECLNRAGNDTAESFFTTLGYNYIGSINGHIPVDIVNGLLHAKESKKVTVLHLKTEKGKGYPPAKTHPFKMHFSFSFDENTGVPHDAPSKSYQDTVASAIFHNMERDQSIATITPSTLYATALSKVFAAYPERCFDPGMTEQHAMTLALGLHEGGMKPILFYQSTFLQRAFDQLFHDICFQNVPALIFAVRSGFAGYDHPTHHGIYDFSYLSALPNLRLLYPATSQELYNVSDYLIKNNNIPTIVFMPYGKIQQFELPPREGEDLLRPQLLDAGGDVLLVGAGNKIFDCICAAEVMKKRNLTVSVLHLNQLCPLPQDSIKQVLMRFRAVLTVEESVCRGGIGQAISAFIAENDIPLRVRCLALPSCFIEHGSNEELAKKYHLTVDDICNQLAELGGKL